MNKMKPFFLLAGCFLLGFYSRANVGKSEPSLLQGYVTDAVTKKPISGVVVLATSKGSNTGCEVVTDAEGFFRFSQLPSSQVNLQFDKKGYLLYKRSGLLINEKTTLKINIEFYKEENEEGPEDSEYMILRMLEIN
jgi:Carboxypeptidase regulatory-like domain